MLKDNIKFMKQELVRQQGDTSADMSQVHPHYAQNTDDQPLPWVHHFVTKINKYACLQLNSLIQNFVFQVQYVFCLGITPFINLVLILNLFLLLWLFSQVSLLHIPISSLHQPFVPKF